MSHWSWSSLLRLPTIAAKFPIRYAKFLDPSLGNIMLVHWTCVWLILCQLLWKSTVVCWFSMKGKSVWVEIFLNSVSLHSTLGFLYGCRNHNYKMESRFVTGNVFLIWVSCSIHDSSLVFTCYLFVIYFLLIFLSLMMNWCQPNKWQLFHWCCLKYFSKYQYCYCSGKIWKVTFRHFMMLRICNIDGALIIVSVPRIPTLITHRWLDLVLPWYQFYVCAGSFTVRTIRNYSKTKVRISSNLEILKNS